MEKETGQNSIRSKQFNRGLIFQMIATGSCRTRIELARQTGLAKTTVGNIITEFMDKNVVEECEEEQTQVCGRNPILLKVSAKAPKIIGLLILRSRVEAVLCSMTMEILRTEQIRFPGRLTGELLIQYACEAVARIYRQETNVTGIGVSAIGPVDIKNGVILNPPRFHGVNHVRIMEALREQFPLPVYMEHDNSCAALAEKLFGVGKAEEDFLFLGISDGIGSGLISGGKLFRNSRGLATELGHVSIHCQGPPCSCGNQGCLEMYASTGLILDKLRTATGLELSYEEYFRLPDCRAAREILEEMIQHIAAALVSVINMLHPELLVLGHDCMDWDDASVALLEQIVNEKRIAQDGRRIPVKKAYFGRQSQLVGAAAIVVSRIFSGELQL